MDELTWEVRTERFAMEFGKDVCSGGLHCPEPGTVLTVESCAVAYDAVSDLGRVEVFLRGNGCEWLLLTSEAMFNPGDSGEDLVRDTAGVLYDGTKVVDKKKVRQRLKKAGLL